MDVVTLRDLFASLVRTAVPYGVGLLLSWLATRYGVVLDDGTAAHVSAGAAVVAGTAYYALVRVAEAKWPAVGVLLGWRVQPQYNPTDPLPVVELKVDTSGVDDAIVESLKRYQRQHGKAHE